MEWFILAGIRDSVSVFSWDGSSWSSNLTPDNLGPEDSPAAISIEVFNNELYMAIEQHPEYDLQVLKYNGSTWDTISSDGDGMIASGSVYDPKLENINGTLYLHYRIDDVLYIRHLEGTGWVTDLVWEQEWLSDIELVKSASQLYFSSGSASSDFDGGVYRVDNATIVTSLIPDEHKEWFTMGAIGLTADAPAKPEKAEITLELYCNVINELRALLMENYWDQFKGKTYKEAKDFQKSNPEYIDYPEYKDTREVVGSFAMKKAME